MMAVKRFMRSKSTDLNRQSLNMDALYASHEHLHTRRQHKTSSINPSSISNLDIGYSKDSASTNQHYLGRMSTDVFRQESSHIRRLQPSRSQDPDVLTLKSSRRKDELSLELASIALGRTIHVETVPALVSADRVIKPKVKVRHRSSTEVVPLSLKHETQWGEKKHNDVKTRDVLADVKTKDVMIDVQVRDVPTKVKTRDALADSLARFQHKNGDLIQTHTTVLHDPLCDQFEMELLKPTMPMICPADECVKYATPRDKAGFSIQSSIPTYTADFQKGQPGCMLALSCGSKETKRNLDSLGAPHTPQRPPRLKRRNKTLESSDDLSSCTYPPQSLVPPASVTDIQISRENIGSMGLTDTDIFKLGSVINAAAGIGSKTQEAEPWAEEQAMLDENSFSNHILSNLHESPGGLRNLGSASNMESVLWKRESTVINQELQDKQLECELFVKEMNSHNYSTTARNANNGIFIALHGIKSKTMVDTVPASATAVLQDSSDSSDMKMTFQLFLDISNESPKRGDVAASNNLCSDIASSAQSDQSSSSSPFHVCILPSITDMQKESEEPIITGMESETEDTLSLSSAASVQLWKCPHCQTGPSLQSSLTDKPSSPVLEKQIHSLKAPLSMKSSEIQTHPSFTQTEISFLTSSLQIESSGVTSATQSTGDKYNFPHNPGLTDKITHAAHMDQPRQTLVTQTEELLKTGSGVLHPASKLTKKELQMAVSPFKLGKFSRAVLFHSSEMDSETSRESAPGSGKSVKGSNPSEYGFVYSAERPQPPPEVGWVDKDLEDQKISLYSENVLQEGDTTEAVDRESIANLTNTKKQWENILTSRNIGQEETFVKKTPPKWEVKLPYTERNKISSDNLSFEVEGNETGFTDKGDKAMFKQHDETESAIEREIRLAHEREEMMRREKEERQKVSEKQKGQTIIASYEAESESFHPAYNELAEADRGSDLWGVENGGRDEDDDGESVDNDEKNANESIIEREIRLQKEREADVARMRKQSTISQQQQQQPEQQQHQEQHHSIPRDQGTQNEVRDVNHNQNKNITYEEAITNNSSEGESRIARELREQREREEELKKHRSVVHKTDLTDEVDGASYSDSFSQRAAATPQNSQRSSQIEPSVGQSLWQRDVSPFVPQHRKESADSTSSHSTGRPPSDSTPSRRDVRVHPIADGDSDDEKAKPNYFEKQETPIEREMRLARERENELRRQKGLPEIDIEDEKPFEFYGGNHEPISGNSLSRPRSNAQPSESMKKFASSRLQHELKQQKEREHELRSQGKIISSSEEHIEPNKYMEVAGVDKVDGTEKRNFITKKTSVSQYEGDASSGHPEQSTPGGQIYRKTSAVAAGGNMFSYKEFKQTAESKIERELREMREREEELRTRRTSCPPQTPQ